MRKLPVARAFLPCAVLTLAFFVAARALAAAAPAGAATLTLTAPREYQVIQRTSTGSGHISIRGTLTEPGGENAVVEARIVTADHAGPWQAHPRAALSREVALEAEAPAGGWYRVEVRVLNAGAVMAAAGVDHVGVGEVFVVAGQSNSANHGEEKQTTRSGRVAAFDGTGWQLAHDPQPGASGSRGSFMPPLGDLLVARFNVPVGFVPCGVGATSVREWLPAGATFDRPPTLETRVRRRPDGRWESTGQAFATLVERLRQLGPGGCRAVLWHQGESDANQKDPTRTLPGPLYRESLATIIRESRRAAGGETPWFVAQVSYHSPADDGSPDIRAAQAALWQEGLALAGPDSDALRGEWRERNGQGVHFSGPGLRAHAARWVEKIAPWIESQKP